MVHDIQLIPLSDCCVELSSLAGEGNDISLEGYASFLGIENASNIQITLMINQSYEIDCEVNRSKKYGKYSMGVDIFPAYEFKGKIPSSDIDEIMKITVCTYVDGRRVERKNLRGETLFPVNRSFRNVSCEKNGYMASMEGNALLIQKVDE